MEGQPARRRRSLLRMRHRQRCGDRVAGLPRGRGVTATCLASNQRSPGQHRASAPVFMLRWCNRQHLGPSNRRRRIETVTEYQFDAAPPARTPAFEARQPGSTPGAATSRSFRRRGGFHTAVRRDRHARSGPCCLCSMAMSTPAVNRWDGVRIARAVPVWEFGVVTARRLPTPPAWV